MRRSTTSGHLILTLQSLLPPDYSLVSRRLYRHQSEGTPRQLSEGSDVVITAGTGSGKTEAMFLPIISLPFLANSRTWTPSGRPAPTRWYAANGPFSPQRTGEVGHQPAIRALVLYPMNALVEDQLVRLRRTLDSPAARTWLDLHRGGHRFYFGRYTGQTPVSGYPRLHRGSPSCAGC